MFAECINLAKSAIWQTEVVQLPYLAGLPNRSHALVHAPIVAFSRVTRVIALLLEAYRPSNYFSEGDDMLICSATKLLCAAA